MPLPAELAQMAKELRDSVDELPTDVQRNVFAALHLMKAVTETFGDAGRIALSIAAADFAAE